MIARLAYEEPLIPNCEYPRPPYYFTGRGIVLIYSIPFARVRGIVPTAFTPHPGRRKIWFMVHFHDWQRFHPVGEPQSPHSFLESYYKFSVKLGDELGDFPVKLYLDSDIGIASGVELYGYPKHRADMTFRLDNGVGEFKIERGGQTELDIALERGRGPTARIMSLFANLAARSYIRHYTGNYLTGPDAPYDGITKGPTRLTKTRYSSARLSRIQLREPLQWGILTEEEMHRPKYTFILSEVEAVLDPPEPATSD